MFWSIGRFQPIANGYSGFVPTSFFGLVGRIASFPDAASVRALRAYGVRSVVLDRRALSGTPWAGAASRPTLGLGVRRSDTPRYVVYDLETRG
jgi:hypothetical protein